MLRAAPMWGFIAIVAAAAFNPAYQRVEGTLQLQAFNEWLPLVIDPERSRPGIYFLTGLAALVAMLANPVFRPRRRWISWILAALLLNAVVLAWTGLFFRFAGNGLVLGRFEPRAGYFFATFFYKNHWAAYALLYCGVAACFFFRDLPRWAVNARQAGSGGLALVAILFLGLTFPLAESRSGILLLAVLSLLFALLLFRRLHARRGRLLLAVGAVVALGGFTFLTGADLRSSWLRTERQLEQAEHPFIIDGIRAIHAPEVCLHMLRDRPLFGWGYLSYDPLFPVYATDFFRDAEGNLKADMEFAHSDYLQHVAEFGLLASALLFLQLALLFRPVLRWAPHLLIFCPLALFALWDFPLSNPAVLASAGVLLALLHSSSPRGR